MKKSKKKVLGLCIVMALTLALLPGLLPAQEREEKININQGSIEELTQLHRIGPKYAERIIEYREKNGPFEKPEDIMKVPGIGQKTWETNKDRITVE